MRYITFMFIVLLTMFSTSFGVVQGHHDTVCSAELDEFPLGSYDPIEGLRKRVPAVLIVRCSGHKPVNFIIKLVGGNSGSPLNRYLYSSSTGAKLYYNIYINGGCILGDGSNGTCILQGSYQPKHHGGVQEIRFTLIGELLPDQNVSAANDYRDTLIIQIEY